MRLESLEHGSIPLKRIGQLIPQAEKDAGRTAWQIPAVAIVHDRRSSHRLYLTAERALGVGRPAIAICALPKPDGEVSKERLGSIERYSGLVG